MQHNGHVGSIEQTDGVRATDTTLTRGFDRNLDAEALKINHSAEDNDSSDQVHDIGEILAVECFLESDSLIGPSEEQMDQGDDGALEFGTTTGIDGSGRESLPHDGLADIGSDEERNTAAETVALLEKLIEENDNQASNDELDDEENADASTEIRWLPVETRDDIDDGLSKRQENGEELLGGLVELTVGLEVEVDIDEMGTGEELENHARGNDGRDSQFHECSPVTRHHHTQPVERIRRV